LLPRPEEPSPPKRLEEVFGTLVAQGAAEAGGLPKAVEVGYELANLDFGVYDIGRLLDEWQSRMQKA
jgi:hypothetical protein